MGKHDPFDKPLENLTCYARKTNGSVARRGKAVATFEDRGDYRFLPN